MTQGSAGYVYQGSENDRLFRPSSTHQPGMNCVNCHISDQIQREKRETEEPSVHYGTVGSGNILVKNAATRDQILEEVAKEIICLEMEAAGPMTHFPCLVIRGISDYADSHKNDRWRKYAAATAAA
jgi:nucleoside phosphorylase